MMDINHRGLVARQKAEQALAQFEASRGGGDGRRRGGMMQRMFDQLFANTPAVTLRQVEAQTLARFDAQILNHDGIVTPEERQQFREQHSAEQGPVTSPSSAPGARPRWPQ